MTKNTIAIRKNKTSTRYVRLKKIGCVLSCVGIAVYCITLVITITSIATKKQLVRAVRDEATTIAELEQSYYGAVKTITLASVQASGYQVPEKVSYGSLRPQTAFITKR